MHRALAPAFAATLALTFALRGDRLLAQAPPEANAAATADAPAKKFPCPSSTLTDDQRKILGAKFLQAWICRTSGVFWHPLFSKDLPPTWQKPFRPLDLNGYGCYCGSGSSGLDTTPVDGYDECCRHHDIDWTAICQNTDDPNKPGTGCDCYVNVPFGTGCKDNKLTFPAPNPEKPNPCRDKCAEELNKQFDCYAKVYDNTKAPPDLTKYRNQCMWEHYPNPVDDFGLGNVGPGSPFLLVPSYCKKSAVPVPGSTFGPVDPGTNVHSTCGCWLDTPDCSSYVMGCARSAEACEGMGGYPTEGCCVGGGCNVDVTAQSCPYRNPNDRCQRFSCGFGATEGDPCDPLTGNAGEGGTCQLVDEDLFLCFPNLPVGNDRQVDVESLAATPVCSVEGTAARSPQE